MANRLEVTFAGGTTGVGPLTWGQQHMWEAINASGNPMNLCAVRPLAAGARADEFVAEVRYYLERFESTRTVLRLSADGSLPTQRVVASGSTYIDIIDVAAGDPASVATALAAQEETTHFDLERELPIRMTLIRHDGAFTHLVMTLCHLAADGAAGFVMYLDHTRNATEAVRIQPLELAARQQQPTDRRHSDTALAYWSKWLRSIPMRRFHDQPPHDGPYAWEIHATSPLLFLAVEAIAERLRSDTGTVLLTLWALAVARLTPSSPVVIQVLVGNRFRSGLADIVSTIFQGGLIVVDVTDAPFDEAIVRTRRASQNAAKHAYYDFGQWQRLVAEISAERGGEIQLGCFFNNRPAASRSHERTVTAADIASASRGEPTVVQMPKFHEGLMLNATELVDAYHLEIRTHTRFVGRDDAVALVGVMEDLAAAAVDDALRSVPVGPAAGPDSSR